MWSLSTTSCRRKALIDKAAGAEEGRGRGEAVKRSATSDDFPAIFNEPVPRAEKFAALAVRVELASTCTRPRVLLQGLMAELSKGPGTATNVQLEVCGSKTKSYFDSESAQWVQEGDSSRSMTSYHASVVSSRSQDFFDHIPPLPPKPFTDPSRLAPEDAFLAQSPLQLPRDFRTYTKPINSTVDLPSTLASGRKRRDKDRGRSSSRRGKGVWKKLLWVKQPKYPDNYTDPPTFLSHLQRNPRLQPYDFWPLVADSTVIVQHLSSVAIFACCFVGIYQEQISPKSVISLGSSATVLGWILWDFWVGQVEAARAGSKLTAPLEPDVHPHGLDVQHDQSVSRGHSRPPSRGHQPSGLGLTLPHEVLLANGGHSCGESVEPAPSVKSDPLPIPPSANGQDASPANNMVHGYNPSDSAFSQRNQQRLATMKSAILIVCTLYVLSPILKSLTMSTSSDSIWAISATLMGINILFFDYSGGIGVKYLPLQLPSCGRQL
ncbi:MAG: hypothetical protein Q9211_000949 [Gyalolechia sp. 1 TL-2023]